MDRKTPRQIDYHAILPFKYAAGRDANRFFCELRDNKKIMATKCGKCGNAYVPPRPVCGECFESLTEWIEVGPKATLVSFTVVAFSFLDPLTGKKRPVPYGYGLIQFDGAATKIQHFLEESDIANLKAGMRVEPVFKETRIGNFGDIIFFRAVTDDP